MPTYKITSDKTGKVYRLTGDRPPTPAEVEELVAQYETQDTQTGDANPTETQTQTQPKPRSIAEAILPRTDRSGQRRAGIGSRAVSLVADIGSLPQRALAGLSAGAGYRSGGGSTLGSIREGLGELARTSSDAPGALGVAQRAALDPTLLLPGVGVVGGAARVLRGGSSLGRLAKSAAVGAGTGAASGLMQSSNGGSVDLGQAAIPAAIGAALPFAGATVAGTLRGVGRGLQETSLGIQNRGGLKTTGNPYKAREKLETVAKYDLWGKPRKVFYGATALIDDKYQQLKDILAKQSNAGEMVNPLDALNRAERRAVSDAPDGEIYAIKNKFASIRRDIIENGRDAGFDLADAQIYKQKIGDHADGYWDRTKSSQPPEHRVYKTFYNELKNEIEQKGGPEVKPLNAEMSKLISLRKDAARRATVQERNNWIPLDEGISLVGAALGGATGNIGPAALYIAQRAGKMPSVAKAMYKTGEKISGAADAIEGFGKRRMIVDKQGKVEKSPKATESAIPTDEPASTKQVDINEPTYKRRGIDIDKRIESEKQSRIGQGVSRLMVTRSRLKDIQDRIASDDTKRLADLRDEVYMDNLAKAPAITRDRLAKMRAELRRTEKSASANSKRKAKKNLPGDVASWHILGKE